MSVSKADVSTVSLLEAIAAQALMSALTIEPSCIFAEVTALSDIEPVLTFDIGFN